MTDPCARRRLVAIVGVFVATVLSAGSAGAASAEHVTVRPTSGPVGTVVHFSGRFTQDQIRSWGGARPTIVFSTVLSHPDCALYVTTEDLKVHVNARSGQVRGSFVVGSSGLCRPSAKTRAVEPELYTLAVGCVSCNVATFEVTRSSGQPATLPFTGRPLVAELLAGAVFAVLGGLLLLLGNRRRSLAA